MEMAGPGVDWRDARAYAPLLQADRSVFAWEWLRRDPAYRRAAEGATDGTAGAQAWGLHRFEDPRHAAPEARPLWRVEDHPYILGATAVRSSASEDAIDLRALSGIAAMAADAGGERWLLTDGLRTIRLDVLDGTAASGPVILHFQLAGRVSLREPLLTLRRLLSLVETGGFSRALHPAQPRARRLVLALRAHDALAAGANQREIASVLFSAAAADPRWRIASGSVRSQVQRLVRTVRAIARGGYRELLR